MFAHSEPVDGASGIGSSPLAKLLAASERSGGGSELFLLKPNMVTSYGVE